MGGYLESTEQERLNELLRLTKGASSIYNSAVNEAETPALRTALLTVLGSEHRIAEGLIADIAKRKS